MLPDYYRTDANILVVPRSEPPTTVFALNWAVWHLGDNEAIDTVGFMGDDAMPRTPGWDEQIENALEFFMIVYPNALLRPNPRLVGPTLPDHVFMRASIINALGYMAPPILQHLFVDNVWYAWGRNTSMKYLEETHIEHMHPIAEKAEWDDVYALGNSKEQYVRDNEAFAKYMENDLDADIAKIRTVM